MTAVGPATPPGSERPRRWAWAEIDLGAVAHNVEVVRRAVAPADVWAIVKADAYGHGAAAVAQALYTSPEECAANLAALAAAGFLEAVPEAMRYRYCADDGARRELIDTLQEVYRQRRVTVIELIYSKPSSRVQTFADAFRLR